MRNVGSGVSVVGSGVHVKLKEKRLCTFLC